MANKSMPVWAWIGCGCVLCIVLAVAGIAALGFTGFTFFKGMVDDMADPLARAEATMQMLGAEKLPDDWQAHAVFTFPWVMKIAILTDSEQPQEAIEGSFEEKAEALEDLVLRRDRLGENVFIYLDIRGRGDEPFEDLLSGKPSRQGVSTTNVDLGVEMEAEAELGTGSFEVGDQKIQWRAHRGFMETLGGEDPGIYAVARIVCPNGESRDALWFQRLPASEADASAAAEVAAEVAREEAAEPAAPPAEEEVLPAEEEASPAPVIDAEGTPADPAALRWLFGHFDLCHS